MAHAERALALREQSVGPVAEIAIARVVLARALMLEDAHSARAVALAEQACGPFGREAAPLPPYLPECEAFAEPRRD